MVTAIDFALVRPIFGGKLNQTQVSSLEAIKEAWEKHGDGDPRKLAYIFGTAFHETLRFKYMREIWGPTAAQKRYEGRKDLGNTVAGDGKKFLGRGFVQITGRRNYTDWSKRLGFDLINEPGLASAPTVAARIIVQGMMLGTFTGKKLGDYITKTKADYVNARRTVNGTDRAALIAGYATKFLPALSVTKQPAAQPAPQPKEVTVPAKVQTPASDDPMGDFQPSFTAPKETAVTASALQTATKLLLPDLLKVLVKDSTPGKNVDAPEVAAVIAKEIAPMLVNASNQEPWYRSRVILGTGTAIVASIAGIFGLALDPAIQSEIVDLTQKAILIGTQVVALAAAVFALWGRIVSKKPLGQ